MDEKSFFSENGVSVSNVRFIAQGQTHAMSGVTSVKAFRKVPPRKAIIIMGVIGVLEFGFGNTFMKVIGLVTIAGAVALWFLKKTEFSVMLSSASGENSALTSKDGEFISRVVGALNDAIVHRG